SFAVPKPDGIFRIFCLGGSTTLGYPYPAEFAWTASLERRLTRLFPKRQVEVINLGGTSYGSSRTLAVLRGILDYQLDMVIVATGDAEFVEDSFRVAVSRPAPAVSWLHGLYLSRVLKQVLPEKESARLVVDAEDRSAAGFLFTPVVAGTVYQVDNGRRSVVMAALGENLSAMTEIASKAGVPMMLATLPANVASWPPDPDSSLPPEPALRRRWQKHIAVAEQLATFGNFQGAIGEYAAAAKLWSGNATVCYEYGQLLIRMEQFEEARAMLLRALDLDPTPVRANAIVNQSIRVAAAQAGILLADTVRTLENLSSHGLIGEELILDYAHPTPRGHVEIARAVLQTFLTKGSGWSIGDVQEVSVHQTELARLVTEKPVINAGLSFALGQVFERKGLMEKAADMYRQAISQGYQGPFPTYNLSRLLTMQGRYAEALSLAAPLVNQYPGWKEPYGLLGYLQQQLGNAPAALDWYQRAIHAGDLDPRLYASLAAVELATGQSAQARLTLEKGLLKHPDNCDMAMSLGRLLEQESAQNVKAEDFYRERLAVDSSCQLLWEDLGLLLMQQRRWNEAEKVFIEALQQPAPLAQHRLNLGYVYLEGLKDRSAAGKQFARFLRLKPEQANLVPVDFRPSAEAGGQL
ncbi:MAG: tetratricopeptide repeat protein, partial [Desulfuromonadales bacterium]|nr:tetratricopeptide repeat protein [Desulfuromonadales bacterium]